MHLGAYVERFPCQRTRFSVLMFQEIMVGPQYQATVPILHFNRHSEKGEAVSLYIFVLSALISVALRGRSVGSFPCRNKISTEGASVFI